MKRSASADQCGGELPKRQLVVDVGKVTLTLLALLLGSLRTACLSWRASSSRLVLLILVESPEQITSISSPAPFVES